MGHRGFVCVILAASWLFLFFAGAQASFACHKSDRRALLGFMAGLQTKLGGWNEGNSSSNCCEWEGVSCNSSSSLGLESPEVDYGRVVTLELQSKRLVGKLSDSLGGLDQLRALNLSHNSLKSSLPVSLFNLTHLQVLDMSFNELHGPLPDLINLTSVQYLDMSQNDLHGSLPDLVCAASSVLRVLKLAANFFSGEIPPGFSNCASLEHLCLGMNVLTGVSDGVFRLKKLSELILADNNLGGLLSGGIGNLTSLLRLDVSTNEFLGPIPNVFQSLGKLQAFVAHTNRFTGNIPASLSNSPTISTLNLRNNSLEGTIQLNCSAMLNLTSLDLGTNQFSGLIPDYLPSCRHLNNINLARNKFHGEIPQSFKDFDSLSYFSLSNATNTNLTSALRILQNCKNLTTLVLSINFHNDELPQDPDLHFATLKILVIANCGLRGSFPPWLRKSDKLQLVDVSWNRLVGTVPAWLGDYQFLFYLDVSNNSLTGEIPRSLATLPSLINRDTQLEEPSPDFPFFMRRNVSVRGLQYNQVRNFPPTLDLSWNKLHGPIWPEIGNLRKLHFLDLKVNNLSGEIPSNLSGMSSLESMDLSNNSLSGMIPPSLVRLSFLSKFSVAYNNLHGEIPTGGQFGTFPNSSFEGNDLCGDHVKPCAVTERSHSVAPEGSGKKRGIVVGITIGVVLGAALFLAFLFVFVLRKHSPGEVDTEKDEDTLSERALEQLESKLVILFQNKENGKELSVDDLMKSTDNFDQANIIGCGGFGLVYRATLPDGRKVAIKRLSGECGQMDREFQAEVETLSRAQHLNLVLLQGYCMYKRDRLLIYSYMENGSLDYWLHERIDGPAFLKWEMRLRVACGSARGLAYLHQSCEPHILHRDIKSSNILLDDNFEAHLADFGLARVILPYDTHVSTDLVGTLGYIPPEYGQASVATYKGDIYSFGVVLLELLTGKRPMDMCKPRGFRDLISWVFQMRKENKESEVFDPVIYSKENETELRKVLDVACLCLSEIPKGRPTTQQLVTWLDSINTQV